MPANPTAVYNRMTTANAALIEDHTEKFVNVAPPDYPTVSLALIKTGGSPKNWHWFWSELGVLPDTTVSAGVLLAATVNAQQDTLEVASTLGARAGKIAYIVATHEQSFIKEVVDDTHVTLIRYLTNTETGGASGGILVGDTIQWLDSPMDEGWLTTPAGMTFLPGEFENYVQTWVEPIKITGRQQAIYEQGGGEHGFTYEDMLAQAMIGVKKSMGFRLLNGGRGHSDGAAGVNTITGGMPWYAAFYNTAATNYANRLNFELGVKEICLKSGEKKLLMGCSESMFLTVQRLYQAGTPGYYGTGIINEVGVDVERVRVFWNGVTLFCYHEPGLVDYADPANNRVLGQFRIWSPKWVSYRPLRKTGQYKLPRTGDLYEEIFLAEGGFQFSNSQALMCGEGVIRPTA